MSEPTYRIRIERDEDVPAVSSGAYDAMIFRVSDGELMRTEWGQTPEFAEEYALNWIKAQTAVPVFITLYATADGELCDPPAPVEPQSLRA